MKRQKKGKSEKSKNQKFQNFQNPKNQKFQNFRTRGLTPRYENQKNENFNHAIFKGCRIHVPHAPSSRITMMVFIMVILQTACCVLRESIHFLFNDLFSHLKTTGNTHHGFWFSPRGIQCKYPWWYSMLRCKYPRGIQCKYPWYFTSSVNTFGIHLVV